MSSGNGSKRLPSLKSSSVASGLKFKPKFVARRTKEERDASAPKIKQEESQKPAYDKKKAQEKRPASNQQRRVPRYLNNTHVISSGPLAAGNFVSDKGGDFKKSFIKSEGGSTSLVHKGLQTIDNAAVESEDDQDDADEEKKETADNNQRKSKSKFNMGREYTVHELTEDNYEEEEFDSDVNMDDEAWQAKRVEELFPIRPIRIRHDDLDTVQKEVQDSFSEGTTREATPMIQIKKEDHNRGFESKETDLQQLLKAKEENMLDRIKKLNFQEQFRSLDEKESLQEMKNLTEDHLRIWKKLNKINNKPKRFVLFQLPSKLPSFEEITPKTENEQTDHRLLSTQDSTQSEQENKQSGIDFSAKKNRKQEVVKENFTPQDSLTGKIGSLRVHKSGRLSVEIGGVIMDINRGADTSFLQDVASVNDNGETPTVELLGRLDGRMVVTPRF